MVTGEIKKEVKILLATNKKLENNIIILWDTAKGVFITLRAHAIYHDDFK